MTLSPRQSLLAAVLYADIFSYPLTPDELRRWGVVRPGGPLLSAAQLHRLLGASVAYRDGYFLLRSRHELVALRRLREASAREKWRKLSRYIGWFGMIPTVRLVGITGGLAMNNTDAEDDIDVFFIVDDGAIWSSRVLLVLLADLLGIRRTVADPHVTDKLCLNMFVTVHGMSIPVHERNLYTAHEVLQVVPVWQRDQTYRDFLMANDWVKAYLPQAWQERREAAPARSAAGAAAWQQAGRSILRRVDGLAGWMQRRYMQGGRTTEVVSNDMLRFHPNDAAVWVAREFTERARRHGLPLDKIFFHG